MADRLIYKDTEINRCDARDIVLDLVDGFDSEAEVRGRDWVIPQASGQEPGTRILDRRVIRLRGYVRGIGTDDEERELSYRELIDELHAIFDPTTPGTLTVYGPYLGLPEGTIAEIENVRYLNAIWGPFMRRQFRTVDVEMESITPDWAVGSS